MPLPLTRDYNSADTGPLAHTVVNNLQDAVVSRKHGAIIEHYSGRQFRWSSQWVDGSLVITHSTVTGANAYAPLNLPEGTIITDARFFTENSGAVKSIGAQIVSYDEIGDGLVNETSAVSSTASGKNTLTLTTGMPVTIAAARLYFLLAFAGAGSTDTITVHGARITFHKP